MSVSLASFSPAFTVSGVFRVTNGTWDAIMEFENLHAEYCLVVATGLFSHAMLTGSVPARLWPDSTARTASTRPRPAFSTSSGLIAAVTLRASKLMVLISVNLPFDRHDWVVDRCGKEVRYTIDYYSTGYCRTYNYSCGNIYTPTRRDRIPHRRQVSCIASCSACLTHRAGRPVSQASPTASGSPSRKYPRARHHGNEHARYFTPIGRRTHAISIH